MTTLRVNIEPLDTVFFRDHRPFEAGVDGIADSVLPSPLTVFGFIGSSYLDKKGTSLRDFMNTGDVKLGSYDRDINSTKITVKGPFFTYQGMHYFPSPANLWSSGNKTAPHVLLPKEEGWKGKWDAGDIADGKSLRPLAIPTFSGRNPVQPEPLNWYISAEGIRQYLRQELFIMNKHITIVDPDDLYAKELRFGTAIDKLSNTAATGYLYSSQHLRFLEFMGATHFRKASFLVFVDGLEAADLPDGFIPFGGEGRMVSLSCETMGPDDHLFPPDDDVIERITTNHRLSLYFLTPAVFDAGWRGTWDSGCFEGLSLVGAAVNKPFHISGWSRNESGSGGNPRCLFKAAPAGSVYFFETAKEWGKKKIEEFYAKYHFNESLSDRYKHAGFGIALVGTW